MINYFDFKTKLIFVDDNSTFLNAMEIALNGQYFCDFYQTSGQFIESIELDDIEGSLRNLLNDEENSKESQSVISLDMENLIELISDLHKGNNYPIATIFMDYSLADTNGLALLSMVKQKSIRKILLTGEMNDSNAIEAFNTRKIDGYLSKGTSNLKDEIQKIIKFSSTEYLKELNSLVDRFFSQNENVKQLYKDQKFVDFYNSKYEELNIQASSIFDPLGSRVLMAMNNKYSFNVYWEEEITNLVIPESNKFRGKLESREVVLDFKGCPNTNIPNENKWEELLVSKVNIFEIGGTKVYVTIKPLNDVQNQ